MIGPDGSALSDSVRSRLLAGRIDYAGLFPPAGLPMVEAVANYASYRGWTDAWALGRFVVPAARLTECLAAIAAVGGSAWQLSVTLGADPVVDLAAADLQQLSAARLGIALDCFEGRVDSADAVQRLARALAGRRCYGEVPLGTGRDAVLDALVRAGARAKIRMGGVTPETFPDATAVAAFLVAVSARRLPFKATAGLHHPVRGRFRLTYESGGPSGVMFGYLNLMAAAALALQGEDLALVRAALEAEPPAAFRVAADELMWGNRRIDLTGLSDRFDGFGSCSFREPVDELEPAVLS